MNRKITIVLSASLTLLIVAVAVMLGRREEHRLAAAETRHQMLLWDAARPSEMRPPTTGGGDDLRSGARDVRSVQSRVQHLLVLFRSVAAGSKFASELKWMALFQGLVDADAATLRQFLLAAFEEPGVKSEDTLVPITQALLLYAEKSPADALELFGKARQSLGKREDFQGMGEQVVANALAEWGKRDPLAAAAWLRELPEEDRQYLTENARRGLVTAAAARDPGIAFRLLGEVGVSDRAHLVLKIMSGAAQAGEAEVAVAALRAHLAGLAPEDRRAAEKFGMEGLAWGLSSLGFSGVQPFLRKAGLDQGQLDRFSAGVIPGKGENGAWLSWMGDHLSQPALEREAGRRVAAWARGDYQAAGTWLAGLPAGDLREISTQAYAQAAARYDPETAVQWARTLPPGKRRSETLATIHRDWPDDVPGKATFVAENGLK